MGTLGHEDSRCMSNKHIKCERMGNIDDHDDRRRLQSSFEPVLQSLRKNSSYLEIYL